MLIWTERSVSMIIERIKRPIENNICITKGSTPIVYFGDYDSAKACTISLNPSDREFLDKNGRVLTGDKERLCSRIKLRKNDTEILTDNDAEIVLNYCKNYFKKNPYKNWFYKYDYIINKFGYSFYNNTCVHLDLIQWATTPFWNDLSENIKLIHLKNDLPFLEHLLNKNFEIIFLNGSTVVSNVSRHLKSITLKEKELVYKNNNGNTRNIKIYIGKYNNIKIIGWSIYLQSPSVGGYNNIDILYDTIKNNL
jgi:hypothetical protein